MYKSKRFRLDDRRSHDSDGPVYSGNPALHLLYSSRPQEDEACTNRGLYAGHCVRFCFLCQILTLYHLPAASVSSVTVVSIVRLYFLHEDFVNHSPDAGYSLGFCVSSIECNLAIITACGPALWPILRGWLPRGFTDVYRSGSLNAQRIGIQLTPSSGKRTQSDSGTPMDTEANTPSQDRFMESRGSNGRCKTHILGNRLEDSDEEVLMHESAGIVRTMDYSVVHEDQKDALRRTDTF